LPARIEGPHHRTDTLKVNFAHLCDYASVSREGKLSVMGIFANIFAKEAPIVHGAMHLAFELEIQRAELGRKNLIEIRLAAADGQPLLKVEAEIQVSPKIGVSVPSGTPIRVPQVVAFNGVKLPQFGPYSFDIFVNGDHKQGVSFDLTAQVPPTLKG
jgi:hypothetical protein